MTDRARELLERVLEVWDEGNSHSEISGAFEVIRDFLSTPKPTQDEEPVAWTNRQEINALTEECTVYMYAEPMEEEDNIPLYLHPAPRKPFVRLSEEEVKNINDSIDPKMGLAEAKKKFARAIEDALEDKNK